MDCQEEKRAELMSQNKQAGNMSEIFCSSMDLPQQCLYILTYVTEVLLVPLGLLVYLVSAKSYLAFQ